MTSYFFCNLCSIVFLNLVHYTMFGPEMVNFIPIYRYFGVYDVTKILIYRYIESKGLKRNSRPKSLWAPYLMSHSYSLIISN